jgi:hypothetical protein
VGDVMHAQENRGSVGSSTDYDEMARSSVCATSATRPNAAAGRDPLYLFACHLEWRDQRNITAYQQLVAALDDPDNGIRGVAENLLHRCCPRPKREEANVEAW